MAALNQCTFAYTSTTPIIQYYFTCATCAVNGGEEIVLCINCSTICHDGHKLSPLLRQKVFCQCDTKGNCCRTLPREDPDHLLATTNSKKRKHSESHCASSSSSSAADRLIVWVKYQHESKHIVGTNFDSVREANAFAQTHFEKENPWRLSRRDLLDLETYTRESNRFDHLHLRVSYELPRALDVESWEVGVGMLDQFLQDFDYHKRQAAINNGALFKVPPPVPASRTTPSTTSSAAASAGASTATHGVSLTQRNLPKAVFREFDEDEEEEEDDRVVFDQSLPAEPKAQSLQRTTAQAQQLTHAAAATATTAATAESSTGKRVTRPKKDPHAPKGPQHAYMIFCNDNREKFQKENPTATMVEITKALAQRWKTMSLDDKAPYEIKARDDKTRYYREMEDFKRRKADGTFVPPEPAPKKSKKSKTVSTDKESSIAEEVVAVQKAPSTDEAEGEDMEEEREQEEEEAFSVQTSSVEETRSSSGGAAEMEDGMADDFEDF